MANYEAWSKDFAVADSGARMDIFLSPFLPPGSVRPVLVLRVRGCA
jgi:hypothetical protein